MSHYLPFYPDRKVIIPSAARHPCHFNINIWCNQAFAKTTDAAGFLGRIVSLKTEGQVKLVRPKLTLVFLHTVESQTPVSTIQTMFGNTVELNIGSLCI